nr:DUF2336 domain-containing protein [Methylobacterium sp. OTU13CASTA1]
MIIRQFLALTQHASAARRAEAAGALVRATLHGGLAPDTAGETEATILALLDDPAPMVRRALAEACAASATAPRSLVVALAGDLPDIAGIVLRRSPVLTDADLVDGVAIGCEATRRAIAERRDLSHAVAGAMAEIAGPVALTALVGNHSAGVTTGSLLRLVARHGDDAALREAVLARPHLPLEVRQACTDRVAESLARLAVASGWLTPARGERAGREARERATLAFSVGAHPIDLARLVAHLRRHGQLNAGLILRAILSGHMPFAETALADLAGLPAGRVAGLMHEGANAAYAALHRKAGLPEPLLPAFSAALSAWREAGRGETAAHGAALSRLMIERALTACESMPFAEAQGVMALLARFEAEAARDAARTRTRTMTERAALAPPAATDFPEARIFGMPAFDGLLSGPQDFDTTYVDAQPLDLRAVESEILDAEWREAQQQVPPVPQHAAAMSRMLRETAEITGHREPPAAAVDPSETAPRPEAQPTWGRPTASEQHAPLDLGDMALADSNDADSELGDSELGDSELADLPEAPEAPESREAPPALGPIADGDAASASTDIPDAVAAEDAPVASRSDPVGLILEALPRAILAQFQEDRAEKQRAAERADEAARAATVADILDTIPNALVASYRADRERVRLAA